MTYEWLIPVGALGITILIFSFTQWQRKKVESARLTLDLTKRMYDEPVKSAREVINNAIEDENHKLIIEDVEGVGNLGDYTIYSRHLEDYLNELEQIGLFVNKKVLDKEFAYEMFGYQIVNVWKYPEINDYIKKQREDYQTDLWSHLEKAYKKFKKMQDEKKVKPASRKFSKNLKK